MKKKLMLPFFLLVSILTLAQDFKTLETEAYAIQYPSTWEVNQSGQMGMKFAILAPAKVDGDSFRENVNLLVQDIRSYDLDLAGFVNLSTNQITSMISGAEIIESTNKGNYHSIIYKGTTGQLNLQFIQYYWVQNGNAYVLTFTAEQTEFDRYKSMALQIMDSFEIR